VSEWLALAAVVLAASSGVPGLFASRGTGWGERSFVAILTLACGCAAAAAVGALFFGSSGPVRADWPVPGGRFAVAVDAVSAMFVLHVAVLAAAGAWYGLGYWAERDHPGDARTLRVFYGGATAGMLLLVVAQNAVLFLAGWEIMALAAFLLVSTEDEKPTVRAVGYLYLLVFLGLPRTPDARHAHEPPMAMLLPMALLAACCAFVGLGAPLVSRVLTSSSPTGWAPERQRPSLGSRRSRSYPAWAD
jgi:formate hydrogenlyase subunit 3/multisubunit Na+/H+ antiporter MnhD subunit